ncbi:hypothetical protein BJ742DRAFT_127445 [Cladochytrium replicatum]|nr:hypothetical protein BJ742DRAFT_127445 [Cladochytrium replicatum]
MASSTSSSIADGRDSSEHVQQSLFGTVIQSANDSKVSGRATSLINGNSIGGRSTLSSSTTSSTVGKQRVSITLNKARKQPKAPDTNFQMKSFRVPVANLNKSGKSQPSASITDKHSNDSSESVINQLSGFSNSALPPSQRVELVSSSDLPTPAPSTKFPSPQHSQHSLAPGPEANPPSPTASPVGTLINSNNFTLQKNHQALISNQIHCDASENSERNTCSAHHQTPSNYALPSPTGLTQSTISPREEDIKGRYRGRSRSRYREKRNSKSRSVERYRDEMRNGGRNRRSSLTRSSSRGRRDSQLTKDLSPGARRNSSPGSRNGRKMEDRRQRSRSSVRSRRNDRGSFWKATTRSRSRSPRGGRRTDAPRRNRSRDVYKPSRSESVGSGLGRRNSESKINSITAATEIQSTLNISAEKEILDRKSDERLRECSIERKADRERSPNTIVTTITGALTKAVISIVEVKSPKRSNGRRSRSRSPKRRLSPNRRTSFRRASRSRSRSKERLLSASGDSIVVHLRSWRKGRSERSERTNEDSSARRDNCDRGRRNSGTGSDKPSKRGSADPESTDNHSSDSKTLPTNGDSKSAESKGDSVFENRKVEIVEKRQRILGIEMNGVTVEEPGTEIAPTSVATVGITGALATPTGNPVLPIAGRYRRQRTPPPPPLPHILENDTIRKSGSVVVVTERKVPRSPRPLDERSNTQNNSDSRKCAKDRSNSAADNKATYEEQSPGSTVRTNNTWKPPALNMTTVINSTTPAEKSSYSLSATRISPSGLTPRALPDFMRIPRSTALITPAATDSTEAAASDQSLKRDTSRLSKHHNQLKSPVNNDEMSKGNIYSTALPQMDMRDILRAAGKIKRDKKAESDESEPFEHRTQSMIGRLSSKEEKDSSHSQMIRRSRSKSPPTTTNISQSFDKAVSVNGITTVSTSQKRALSYSSSEEEEPLIALKRRRINVPTRSTIEYSDSSDSSDSGESVDDENDLDFVATKSKAVTKRNVTSNNNAGAKRAATKQKATVKASNVLVEVATKPAIVAKTASSERPKVSTATPHTSFLSDTDSDDSEIFTEYELSDDDSDVPATRASSPKASGLHQRTDTTDSMSPKGRESTSTTIEGNMRSVATENVQKDVTTCSSQEEINGQSADLMSRDSDVSEVTETVEKIHRDGKEMDYMEKKRSVLSEQPLACTQNGNVAVVDMEICEAAVEPEVSSLSVDGGPSAQDISVDDEYEMEGIEYGSSTSDATSDSEAKEDPWRSTMLDKVNSRSRFSTIRAALHGQKRNIKLCLTVNSGFSPSTLSEEAKAAIVCSEGLDPNVRQLTGIVRGFDLQMNVLLSDVEEEYVSIVKKPEASSEGYLAPLTCCCVRLGRSANGSAFVNAGYSLNILRRKAKEDLDLDLDDDDAMDLIDQFYSGKDADDDVEMDDSTLSVGDVSREPQDDQDAVIVSSNDIVESKAPETVDSSPDCFRCGLPLKAKAPEKLIIAVKKTRTLQSVLVNGSTIVSSRLVRDH